jgi:Na+(H+)/acetate symporter ActP
MEILSWGSFAYVPFVPPEYVPHLYGVAFTLFAMFYSILGGMTSIVWADVIQYTIMTVSAILIGVIAMIALSDNPLIVPEGWMNPFFGTADLDWAGSSAR